MEYAHILQPRALAMGFALSGGVLAALAMPNATHAFVKAPQKVGIYPIEHSITLTSPVQGEAFSAGELVPIRWSTTGNAIAVVDVTVSVMTETGTITETIAYHTPNDGEYVWSAPNVTSTHVSVVVAGSDYDVTVATAFSEHFSIVGTEEREQDAEPEHGLSPITGEHEPIDEVVADTDVRGKTFPGVYRVDSEDVRHPYLDRQTFLMHNEDYTDVQMVTDATLVDFSLGSPMLPKPGTVLVKLSTDTKVYALDEDASGILLRWIVDETTARAIYGEQWADYVIDIPETLWPHFQSGEQIDDVADVDVHFDRMHTRAHLNV